MAVKEQRILLYVLGDAGTEGSVDQTYQLQPSVESDAGYWAAVSYISGHEKTMGTQAEHTVLYDVTMGTEIPLHNGTDAILTVLPDEVPRLKVLSVGNLYTTGEKQARCVDVSDAAYTLTS